LTSHQPVGRHIGQQGNDIEESDRSGHRKLRERSSS
jgi:hypothetical protein